MIFILLQKLKEKLSFIFKKILIPILILFVFLVVNFYYFYDYYIKKGLSFTEEDKFLFALIVVIMIIMTLSYILIVFDRAKILKIINKIREEIIQAEDNCVLVNRDTQELILEYFKED